MCTFILPFSFHANFCLDPSTWLFLYLCLHPKVLCFDVLLPFLVVLCFVFISSINAVTLLLQLPASRSLLRWLPYLPSLLSFIIAQFEGGWLLWDGGIQSFLEVSFSKAASVWWWVTQVLCGGNKTTPLNSISGCWLQSPMPVCYHKHTGT